LISTDDVCVVVYARPYLVPSIFFFSTPPTTETYTLSLHDALPISGSGKFVMPFREKPKVSWFTVVGVKTLVSSSTRFLPGFTPTDRKSTRLNSSHRTISYAVFCLKKKKKRNKTNTHTCQ